jgi:membrane protease YdiL (CAAX protease family)
VAWVKKELQVNSPRSWLRFLVGFGVLWGVLAGTSHFDPTARWGLAILAAVLLTAVAVERFLYPAPLRVVVTRLGLGRPGLRALILAAGVSALVLGVYPVYAVIEGQRLMLHQEWPLLLIGIFALHGLAEEMVWRGYAFRRLRAGRSYWRAVGWAMPLIAVTHLPIVVGMGAGIGVGAMLVAAVTTLAFSYLYETGGRTVWAPAILHTAIDSFKLFVIPVTGATTISYLLIIASIGIPLLVFAVPRRVLIGGVG